MESFIGINELDHRAHHFHPSDSELLIHLTRFLTNNPLESEIYCADLYGQQKPWDIFKNYPSEDLKHRYFYTALKKRKKKNDEDCLRFERSVGEGQERWTWHGIDQAAPIYHGKAIIGFKKTLEYRKKNCDQNKLWQLKEYFLTDALINKLGFSNNVIVLCRLSKKPLKKTSNTK